MDVINWKNGSNIDYIEFRLKTLKVHYAPFYGPENVGTEIQKNNSFEELT